MDYKEYENVKRREILKRSPIYRQEAIVGFILSTSGAAAQLKRMLELRKLPVPKEVMEETDKCINYIEGRITEQFELIFGHEMTERMKVMEDVDIYGIGFMSMDASGIPRRINPTRVEIKNEREWNDGNK